MVDAEYTEADGTKRKLPNEDIKKLKCINSYIIYLQNQHGPDTPMCERIDPLDLTVPMYNDFRNYLVSRFDIDNLATVDDEGQDQGR